VTGFFAKDQLVNVLGTVGHMWSWLLLLFLLCPFLPISFFLSLPPVSFLFPPPYFLFYLFPFKNIKGILSFRATALFL
jgi:hypothetical protein